MTKKKDNEKMPIPSVFRPFLWSYNVDKMDLESSKKRIITNVLNLGTMEATNKLFGIYDKEVIRKIVENPLPGEWNKKSLNFWSLIFDIKPQKTLREIR